MSEYPIVPPLELVKQWRNSWQHDHGEFGVYVATQAARWGADAELEACCANVHTVYGKEKADWLRSIRRPKPPSLAEQALELINKIQGDKKMWQLNELDVVRAALERLQELERGDD